MVNVSNLSNHTEFRMMEVNNELFGFLNDYEINEQIYNDLKND